jgi:hypothetical protein
MSRLACTELVEARPPRIRDLAYGDETRVDDLTVMIESEDLAYREIFEAAYWES